MGSTQPDEKDTKAKGKLSNRRVRTPTVIQMEAVECGAAALGIILGYYGLRIPLEELRVACGVSRDGSNANNLVKAARKYGLIAKGFRDEPDAIRRKYKLPVIVFWNFDHFLVVEGFRKNTVYLNDPAQGPRTISEEEFDEAFTGVVLTFEPGPDFKKGGQRRNIMHSLLTRLQGSETAVLYIMLAGLALVMMGLIIPTFTRIFVDKVLVGKQNWLVALLIGMSITALLRTLVTGLQQHMLLKLETKFAVTTSSQFMWHVLRLPVEFFSQRFAGDISSRVTINNRVAQLLSREIATTLLNLVLIVFYVILMLGYDVLLTVIGIVIALLNIAALQFISRRRTDTNQKLGKEYGKLTGKTYDGLQIIETLKASGAETDFFAQWSGHHAKSLNAEQELATLSQYLNAVPPLLSVINTAAILAIGGTRIMDGYLTIGMLVAFQSLMASFIGPINQIVSLGSTLQEVEGDMNRLDDVLYYKIDPVLALPSNSIATADLNSLRLSGALEIHDVTFGYSILEKPLIEGITISVKPGQRVALVGSSGSGKSTIAKLVAGLYEPWSGEILFDGKPRTAYPRPVITNSLALVDQDISMFEGTIHDNLSLWDRSISDADIVSAAKDAAIHSDIASRNGAYDSMIEENGRNFSGGQRQRLEIARALVNNPTIIILDEATSALDPLTEKIIDDSLRIRGCTCLIVAHRLSTIRDCDEIIVLDQGKIVQRGTHDVMIKRDGPYSRLIRSEEYRQPAKPRLKSTIFKALLGEDGK